MEGIPARWKWPLLIVSAVLAAVFGVALEVAVLGRSMPHWVEDIGLYPMVLVGLWFLNKSWVPRTARPGVGVVLFWLVVVAVPLVAVWRGATAIGLAALVSAAALVVATVRYVPIRPVQRERTPPKRRVSAV